MQDGSWWKRRKEQLDLKSAHVQDLEGKSIRIQATIEACSEEVERLRARLPELTEAEDSLAMAQGVAQGTAQGLEGGSESSASSGAGSSSDDPDLRRRTLKTLRRALLSDRARCADRPDWPLPESSDERWCTRGRPDG